MFRRQPIFDADNGLTRIVGDPLQHRILHVRAAQHPAAAVEMQINPARLRWCDYPQGNFVAVLAGDRQSSRPARHHRGREWAFAAPARGTESLGTDDPSVRLVGQQLDHLSIQFGRFGIDRRFAEQSWIERARVCHGSLLDAQGRYDIVSGIAGDRLFSHQ